ncbi:MAG TPA: rhodanese-like domain-containing protein [Lacunisphaera sp.]
MRRLLLLLVLGFSTAFAAEVAKVAPAAAAQLVADGKAVLVDIREPAEWAESGVAAPAVLLPKSDFDGDKTLWKDFLAKVGDKQIILYCRSGRRAETVGQALAAEGKAVANAGGMKDWVAAGLPTREAKP